MRPWNSCCSACVKLMIIMSAQQDGQWMWLSCTLALRSWLQSCVEQFDDYFDLNWNEREEMRQQMKAWRRYLPCFLCLAWTSLRRFEKYFGVQASELFISNLQTELLNLPSWLESLFKFQHVLTRQNRTFNWTCQLLLPAQRHGLKIKSPSYH